MLMFQFPNSELRINLVMLVAFNAIGESGSKPQTIIHLQGGTSLVADVTPGDFDVMIKRAFQSVNTQIQIVK